MKIFITRHGATAGNLEKRYIGGKSDEPLCPQGRADLVACRHYTDVEHVYTSGMRRTRETAEVLYPGARQTALTGLREMDFGIFEGKNWLELADHSVYSRWVKGGCVDSCPAGESRQEFTDRCVDTFRHLITEQEQGIDALYLVVHGGTIMALLSTLAVPAKDYFFYETPCGGRWVCRSKGDWLEILEAPWERKS